MAHQYKHCSYRGWETGMSEQVDEAHSALPRLRPAQLHEPNMTAGQGWDMPGAVLLADGFQHEPNRSGLAHAVFIP